MNLSLLMVLLLSSLTIQRNEVWKTNVSLWRDAAKKSPWNVRAVNNYGEALGQAAKYDEAIDQLSWALKLHPTFFFALANMGFMYGEKKEFKKSVFYFLQALTIDPHSAPAYYNMGKALTSLGKLKLAIAFYRKAVELDPNLRAAYYNMSMVEKHIGLEGKAEEHMKIFENLQ